LKLKFLKYLILKIKEFWKQAMLNKILNFKRDILHKACLEIWYYTLYFRRVALKFLQHNIGSAVSDDKRTIFYLLAGRSPVLLYNGFSVRRYAYLSRRCISKDECQNMNHIRRVSKMEEIQIWRPFNNSCVTQCPDGFEDHVDDKNVR